MSIESFAATQTRAHLSPFRYPGGKSWFLPHVRTWLGSIGHPGLFVDVFAGGGSVGLSVADEGLTDQVMFVERDPAVAAVWHTVWCDDVWWLIEQIRAFSCTPNSINSLLGTSPESVREQALATIVRNRTSFGGIMKHRSGGFLKGGENGRGIASRWYPETLARRIEYLHTLANRVTFIEGDGLEVLADLINDSNVCLFLDPPYSLTSAGAGKRLYNFHELDHDRLFRLVSEARGQFLMTYDDSDEVRSLALDWGFKVSPIVMRGNHNRYRKEVIISRQ